MNLGLSLDIMEQWSKRHFASLAFLRTVFSFLKVIIAIVVAVEFLS